MLKGLGPITMSLTSFVSSVTAAQTRTLAFSPQSARVTMTANVTFAGPGGSTLAMDVYQLPRTAGRLRPALIFFNRASGADRRSPLYDGWGRAAASRELVGIVPDLREGSEAQDFQALLQPAEGAEFSPFDFGVAKEQTLRRRWSSWSAALRLTN